MLSAAQTWGRDASTRSLMDWIFPMRPCHLRFEGQYVSW